MKLFKALYIVFVFLTATSVLAATGDSVQQVYDKGLQAIKAGDAEKAVALLSQAIALNSLEPRYYNDRGVAYKRLGELDKALADYTKAIMLKPGYTHALNNRGLVYLEQGKYDLAISDFSEALKHGELQSKLYTNMGLAKAKQGDHQGAIKDFDKAFSYQPMDHRSFVFMAESLEKTGDLEKALRTYQLARNLLKDPDTLAAIESRINQLEGQKGLVPPHGGDTSKTPESAPQPLGANQAFLPEKPRPQVREIARAQPFPETRGQGQKTTETKEVAIDSYETLDKASRDKALTKYSSTAREIYRQGQEFMAKADTTKALIRFEDARQLEKRNKNVFTVAWSDVEIARVHTKLGDHVRANTYLQDALRLFEAQKADDQVILTLLELAQTSKHLMEKEKASSFYERAREKATVLGYDVFAQQIADLATGRKVAFAKSKPPEVARPSGDPGQIRPEGKPQKSALNGKEKVAPSPDGSPKASVTVPSGQAEQPPRDTPRLSRDTTQPQPEVSPPNSGLDSNQKMAQSPDTTPKASDTVSAPQVGQTAATGTPPMSQKPQAVETPVHSPSTRSEPLQASDEPPLIFRDTHKVSSHLKTVSRQTNHSVVSESQSPAAKTEPSVADSSKTHDKSQIELPAPPAARHRALAKESRLPKVVEASSKTNKTAPREPSLQEDLALLRDLRKKNDEQQMVPVLERLGRKYFQTGDFKKSTHAYSAAIDLREKLGIPDGMESLLEARAASRENLGNLSEAMEDLARSFYLQRQRGVQPDHHFTERLTRVCKSMGLDPDATVDGFQLLWDSRGKNDTNGELQALLTIASMYDRAGRFSQALVYYDLAAASVTANKAQILEKMGDERLAEQQWFQALDALKNLDYSAYIHIMKQSRIVGARAIR